MSETPTEQSAQPTFAEGTSAQPNPAEGAEDPAASLSVDEVEEQIRAAESLHQELTEQLKATAHQ